MTEGKKVNDIVLLVWLASLVLYYKRVRQPLFGAPLPMGSRRGDMGRGDGSGLFGPKLFEEVT
jgi:hypothetical protein